MFLVLFTTIIDQYQTYSGKTGKHSKSFLLWRYSHAIVGHVVQNDDCYCSYARWQCGFLTTLPSMLRDQTATLTCLTQKLGLSHCRLGNQKAASTNSEVLTTVSCYFYCGQIRKSTWRWQEKYQWLVSRKTTDFDQYNISLPPYLPSCPCMSLCIRI